ncbi:MAG: SEC-C metal-binding domain-containing protein [Thermodesulfobacteriota bacterium]|nr:SEC-C metal-binding domain-containing protein [Thermodesulfobacteriota bacterium]
MLETVKPYVDVELKCLNCGEENIYRVDQIIMSTSGKIPPYIAKDVTCVNCNRTPNFQITADGMKKIAAEQFRLEILSGKDKARREEAFKKSPFRFMTTTIGGKKTGIPEGIKFYLTNIRKNPRDIENYIGLGNIYDEIDQPSKAETCYKKAIQIDPTYIEPYFSLACIARRKTKYESAYIWLEKGTQYMRNARYSSRMGTSRNNFAKAYRSLLNEMAVHANRKAPQLQANAFIKKIGRNDPCICGSGKKYKKCCLRESEKVP